MNVMDYTVALERRVAALEANRGTSLRFAEVTEVDKVGHARVKLMDGDDMVTHTLRTVQRRTLKEKDQCLPDIGEHVACLFSGQGLEQGLVLGAVYSDVNQTDGEESHFGYYRYEDGTTIYYDRDNHKYFADVKGDIDVICTGNVTAEIEGDVTAVVGGDVLLEADGDITSRSAKMNIIEGAAGVRLRGPSIVFENYKGTGRCKARIDADVEVTGHVDHQGDRSHSGNLTQAGSQTTSGSITAGGAVTGNPVNGCKH